MASTEIPKVPIEDLLTVDHLLETLLELAEVQISYVVCRIGEQIAKPSEPRQNVPLEELITAEYLVITTGTTAKDIILFLPRRWYKWVTGPSDHYQQVPLSELGTLRYLFSAIKSSLPRSIVCIPLKAYQHITNLPKPSPTDFIDALKQSLPTHLIETLGSNTLDTLVHIPRKIHDRLTKPSQCDLALKKFCASMLLHTLTIHGGSRLPSTSYSDDCNTIVPDTPTLENSERAMVWSRTQEARDFANGITSDFRLRLAGDYADGLRFTLDEYEMLGEMKSMREALGDRGFGQQKGRIDALRVLDEWVRLAKRGGRDE